MLHCSLLKAIHPKWPTGVPPFLLFRGLCLRCVYLVLPSSMSWFSWWPFSNCPRWTLLKATHSEQLSDKVPVSTGVPSSSSSGWCGQKFQEWSMLLHPLLLLCVQFLFISPQYFDNRISNSAQRLDCSVHNLQPYGLPEGLAQCSSASQIQSLF
jgi:hypothetical protein